MKQAMLSKFLTTAAQPKVEASEVAKGAKSARGKTNQQKQNMDSNRNQPRLSSAQPSAASLKTYQAGPISISNQSTATQRISQLNFAYMGD